MGGQPSIDLFPGGCLYRANTDGSKLHAPHALKLIIPVDGDLELILDGVEVRVARDTALLLPPHLTHSGPGGASKTVLWFDPELYGSVSWDGRGLSVIGGRTGEHLRDLGREVYSSRIADASALRAIFASATDILSRIGFPQRASLDSRVEAAMEWYRQPWLRLDHRRVAKRVGVSASHLSNLFRQQVGISAKRYALWVRTVTALAYQSEGFSATEAARHAGFSDLPHFSRSVGKLLGSPPRRLSGMSVRGFAGGVYRVAARSEATAPRA